MPAPRLILPGLYELALPIPLGTVNVFFILTAGGVALIDTGYPDRGAGVLAGLSALGRRPEDVQHIIVTHHHIDHAGNIAALQARTGAKVWMHPLDAELVTQGKAIRPTAHSAPGWFNRLAFGLGKWLMPATMAPARVDSLVADGAIIPVAGGLEVIHIPGHSAGQIGLRWPAQQVLFAADAVMRRSKRLQSPIVLEDETAAANSLARLDRCQFTTICFGHGPTLSENAAAAFHRYAAVQAG
ncbi:MBL fold metallo-hydrolase [Chloroflexus sp.]|uniref:MBL fold metallo-hydrolase n=1 Tax=Chloroflexus sp. TaxID=1904827 RepID=UPI00298ED818|nr:MBL fold metallo-hydrolase [Chloroflexus sp.]MCS6888757.1 MBL fold metallo-hydrolase [Chloroflexus sp.]MDW8405294.1 MBL fold metallo-hydrolase [Chloroflexus sp.]